MYGRAVRVVAVRGRFGVVGRTWRPIVGLPRNGRRFSSPAEVGSDRLALMVSHQRGHHGLAAWVACYTRRRRS
jgi:hypothetical protein